MLNLKAPAARTISTSAILASNICKSRPKKTINEYRKNFEKSISKDSNPLPVVIQRGKGVYLYDAEGKDYLDFISGNCSVSLGHCHPRVAKVMCKQARILTETSRHLLSTALADYGEYITELFAYDKVLPTTTGTEACVAAIKLAKEWGHKCKGISRSRAKVLLAENGFWGSTLGTSPSSSEDNDSENENECQAIEMVPFNDISTLNCKSKDPNVCAFLLEPIQGDAGVIIPHPCYLKQVREICSRNKILFIADEVQCGLGRTGCLLSCDLYRVRPDILILGKSLSAGFTPVSAILADSDILDVSDGKHNTTSFAGNPLGCVVAMETLKTLQEENLIENAKLMGECLREALCDLPRDIVCEIRGIGLLNAIVLNTGIDAWDISLEMMKHGLLAKSGKKDIIRLSPPLSITKAEVLKAAKIIRRCIENSRGGCSDGDGEKRKLPKCPNQKEKKSTNEEIGVLKLNHHFLADCFLKIFISDVERQNLS